jgi:uncharacterized membrane protein
MLISVVAKSLEDGGSVFLVIVGIYQQVHTVLQPGIPTAASLGPLMSFSVTIEYLGSATTWLQQSDHLKSHGLKCVYFMSW